MVTYAGYEDPTGVRTPIGRRKEGTFLPTRFTDETVVTDAVAATVITDDGGTNNELTWTAVLPGADGNDITITLVDPGEATAEETVEVDGTDITVTLRSNGALSTADQVKTAVAASEEASALVTVADSGGSDGSAAVTAQAETNLTGGTDATEADSPQYLIDADDSIYVTRDTVAVSDIGKWRQLVDNST